MALKIKTGKIKRPVRMCIYGAEGIGKTTLASKAPDPLFIDLEKGSDLLDVKRVSDIDSWEQLMAVLREIKADPSVCKTLIIDTADRADAMCSEYVCAKHNVSGIESFGYGKGYTYLAETFTQLLKALDDLVDTCGINIIITAHGKLRKQELPEESGAFDRWEMKLSKQVAPLVKEWCDTLLFCNYKTMVVETDSKTKKARGGTRVMYTSHNPCWDAKNRSGLPEVLPLDFGKIAHLFADTSDVNSSETPNSSGTDGGGQARTVADTDGQAIEKTLTKKQQALLQMTETTTYPPGFSFATVQRIAFERGKIPSIDTPIEEFSDDLIEKWVTPNWANIVSLAVKILKEEQ